MSVPPPARDPVVETEAGRVRGRSTGGGAVFRGIRYGQPTGGANRFLPPRAPDAWPGTRDALTPPSSAPQRVLAGHAAPFFAWYSAIQPVSEDCLFLNVFTPATDSARRPVMVWLHGGGWGNFASTAPGTDGLTLALDQDVVVVSLNHRLGPFGFIRLASDDDRFTDSGNAGLLDIVLALRWVRANIERFGGDPGRVTIFGQSGGGAKVAALMALPAAEGLFHRAIIQSSSGGMRIAGIPEAETMAAALARDAGLPRAGAEAMQHLPMDALLEAMRHGRMPFRPVLDGRHFTRDPFLPDAPATASRVPLLAGCTDTETSYYFYSAPESRGIDCADVRVRLERFLPAEPAAVARILSAYRDGAPARGPFDTLVAITTDYLFKRNTYQIAAHHAACAVAPTYGYVFAWQTPIDGGWLHAPHTSELPFVFGTTQAAAAMVGTGSDLAPMGRRMRAIWGAFARHADPANPLLPAWPAFGDARATMCLSNEPAVQDDPGGTLRASLKSLPHYEYSNTRGSFTDN